MKHKKIIFAVLIILIVLIIRFLILHKSNNENNYFTQTRQNRNLELKNSQKQEASTTLTGTIEVKSALVEKVELHTTYYLEETYVEENSYVAKGKNILKYTNGTYLTAPYDCYIVEIKLPAEEGKCLNSHYIKIQSKNILTVSMDISEENINKITIGQEAKITISALEKTYKGYVTHIGSTANNGKFTVDIEFENDGNVKLGMTSSIEINI